MSVVFMKGQYSHLQYLEPVPVQTEEYRALMGSAGVEMVSRSDCWSAWHRSRCLGLGGVFPLYTGRAEAWGLFGVGISNHIFVIARHVRRVLDNCTYRRVEITVRADNTEGKRFAKLIGFDPAKAVYMEAYHPDGSDMLMYARVRR